MGTIVRSRIKTFQIDGRDVGAREDETILEAALENGIYIPTLCYLEGLPEIGACRLCMVEIEGRSKLAMACTTHVDEGIVVHTNTERVQRYRRMIVELLFSEGNHICAICVSNGNCELQRIAQYLGMDYVRFSNLKHKHHVDMTHNRFVADNNRCILCTRCVRVCEEIEGAHTWDVRGRGVIAAVISDLAIPWGKSDTCTSCGKCVNVCPTGALVEKGKTVGEMVKRVDFLPYLSKMRRTW